MTRVIFMLLIVASLGRGQTLSEFPDDAVLLCQSAAEAVTQGRYERARATYRAVLDRYPGSTTARHGLIDVSRALADWERVLALAQECNDTYGLANAAWAHYNMKRYDQALAEYTDPRHAGTYAMRLGAAWCQLKLGARDTARAGFEQLQRDYPTDTGAAAGLETLAKDPPSPAPQKPLSEADAASAFATARMLRERNRSAAAVEVLSMLVENGVTAVRQRAAAELADVEAAQGSWSLASYHASVALTAGPAPEALRRKLRCLRQLGQWTDAELVARELLTREKDDALAVATVAQARFVAGDFAGALEFYRRTDPHDTLLEQGRAWSLLNTGDANAARAAFQGILARDPDNTSAREGLRRIEAQK
jgi:tetratricopeptide (TPR) repeat protein